MSAANLPELEGDPRFPSGRWTGFFLQKELPGKHMMELNLSFSQGNMKGEGRDRVGDFVLTGKYTLNDGKCHWTKRYVGKHDVYYEGFNEGKGIWGVWQIPPSRGDAGYRGGFNIWPEGMADPTNSSLHTALDLPTPVELPAEVEELVGAPAGAGEAKG
jgi:hypothetical protein